jgi:hypothetical protein
LDYLPPQKKAPSGFVMAPSGFVMAPSGFVMAPSGFVMNEFSVVALGPVGQQLLKRTNDVTTRLFIYERICF